MLTAPQIKRLVAIALTKRSRREQAKYLDRAYWHAVLPVRETMKDFAPGDEAGMKAQIEGQDVFGRNPAVPEEEAAEYARRLRLRYPHVVQALDLGATVMDLIERGEYYRELGFASVEEWMTLIEDEEYILKKISEL